ncbi:MAG TPA: hypothetical protein VIG51_04515 [Candidatus Baltobacteraceae bacterium]|jgi:hypothetical protein
MRSLAAYFAKHDPALFAICEIDAGDALALATRFAREWAYRGGQALFWNASFRAREVRDPYLPFAAAKPFDRRGLLRVDGRLGPVGAALYATQFAGERHRRIPELRFARAHMRSTQAPALLFAHLARRAIAFEDLGFTDVLGATAGNERVYARGFAVESARLDDAPLGLGSPLRARVRPIV